MPNISPRMASWLQATPFSLVMICFLLAPLILIIAVSFMDYDFITIIPEFYSGNWRELFTNPLTIDLYVTVIRHVVIVWAITLSLGFSIAYFVTFHVRTPFLKAMFVVACVVPFWTSLVIRGISWVPLLGREGLVNQAIVGMGISPQPLSWLMFSEFSVILAYVNMMTFWMLVPILNSMSRIPISIVQAARDQGATEWQTVVEVIMPMIKPGFVVGTIFVVTAIMGDSALVKLMSGNQVNTPAGAIMNDINALQYPPAAAKAVFLLVIVLAFVAVLLRLIDIRKELAGSR